jgi:hypothetical protein
MKSYRLRKAYSLFNAGEIAGFDDADAVRLLKQGVIEPINTGAESAPAQTNQTQPPAKTSRRIRKPKQEI